MGFASSFSLRGGAFEGIHGGGVLRTSCLAFGLFHGMEMKGGLGKMHHVVMAPLQRTSSRDGRSDK